MRKGKWQRGRLASSWNHGKPRGSKYNVEQRGATSKRDNALIIEADIGAISPPRRSLNVARESTNAQAQVTALVSEG